MEKIKEALYLKVFCKKGVLKNFSKFLAKRLRWSLFFNKFAGPQPATLLKKNHRHRKTHRMIVSTVSKLFIKRPNFTLNLNSLDVTSLFLYLLEKSKNLWFSDTFREYRKRPVE